MAKNESKIEAALAEEWFVLSLSELCSSLNISKAVIIEIVDEGIISVEKQSEDEWRFDSQALSRIRTVLRLTNDLGINMAGAGLALELLQEIERLNNLLKKTY